MAGAKENRLLVERPLPRDGQERRSRGRAPRSVTVNLVESPLGWLLARNMICLRQYDAGERLRGDWERAQLGPQITMRWDAPPTGKVARGAPGIPDPTEAQLSSRRRFESAVEAVGPGLSDILWRIVCAGEGMRDAETALRWPARAGRVVLGLALHRPADYYKIA